MRSGSLHFIISSRSALEADYVLSFLPEEWSQGKGRGEVTKALGMSAFTEENRSEADRRLIFHDHTCNTESVTQRNKQWE